MDVDTVIFCIGDKVSESFGLPVEWNSYVKHPNPRFPVSGTSYEAYDPEAGAPIEGVFVAGWAREASTGQVGLARKDAIQCTKAVLAYLETLTAPAPSEAILTAMKKTLQNLGKPIIHKADAERLEQAELAEAQARQLEAFRFSTNAEMLECMGLN